MLITRSSRALYCLACVLLLIVPGLMSELSRQTHTLLDFHPAPLQHAEQHATVCTHRVGANHLRPERRAVLCSSPCRRLTPNSQVTFSDPTEEHEDPCDDVGHRRDAHFCCLLVRCLREESQSDVFVLE